MVFSASPVTTVTTASIKPLVPTAICTGINAWRILFDNPGHRKLINPKRNCKHHEFNNFKLKKVPLIHT